MSFGAARSAALMLLFLAACQQQPVDATNTLAQLEEGCDSGDSSACRQLADATQSPQWGEARLSPDRHMAQVQRDVAAIIRGIQRTSASNGL
jgi:hypothetical protein